MRRAAALLTLALLTVPGAAAAAEEKRFGGEEAGFSVTFPQGWEIVRTTKSLAVASYRDHTVTCAFKSMKHHNRPIAELVHAALGTREYWQDALPGQEKLSLEKLGRQGISGYEWNTAEYAFPDALSPGAVRKGKALTLVRESRSVVVQCTADGATFDAQRPEVERVLQSLRLD